MARPEGVEPPTLCLEADRPLLPNLARGGATGAVSASSGNSPQRTFSFVFPDSLTFCRCFPQLALRFRDSAFSHHNEFFRSPVVPWFFNSLAGTFLAALPELVRIVLTYPTQSELLHPQSRIRDRPQISRDKFDCFQYATAGFTTSAFDGYGLRGPLPARQAPYASDPVFVHRPVFLLHASFRPHLTVTPLRFATLHLHQVGTGLSPVSCRTCTAYKVKGLLRSSKPL
jgi:hypothetical protein